MASNFSSWVAVRICWCVTADFAGSSFACRSRPFASLKWTAHGCVAARVTRLKNVAVEARRSGLCGLEFLEGIPGSVGGALRMNAGAMGGATFDAVESVRVMAYDGAVREVAAREMDVVYRCCATLKGLVALGAVLCGRPDAVESIAQRMSAYSQKRWSSQPAAPSAGCMFKNPPTAPAGRLIDELELKGTQVGGARISQEHGNFLVNDGKATAADVLELIGRLQAKVKAERGIELHTEVEIIGE